jgi:P27 family predicted phage terminase small subunit
MGKRGPAPKTAQQARLEGDKEAQKRAEASHVPASSIPASPPEYLDGIALDMWRHLMACTPAGLYTAMDMPVLVLFCETWAQREMLKRGLTRSKTGLAKGSTGQQQVHAAIKGMRDLTVTLTNLAKQLLLTPDARARLIGVTPLRPPEEPEDENEQSAQSSKQPASGFQSLIGRNGL